MQRQREFYLNILEWKHRMMQYGLYARRMAAGKREKIFSEEAQGMFRTGRCPVFFHADSSIKINKISQISIVITLESSCNTC